MKSINVVSRSGVAEAVWYDAVTGLLYVSFGAILRAVRLELIPAEDFQSQEDIEDFSLGENGTVVVCHHTDGGDVDAGGYVATGGIDRAEGEGTEPKAEGEEEDLN